MKNIITKMNELLHKQSPFDDLYQNVTQVPQLPVIFIVGLPRSGTTPLAQLMIQRFRLGYVSNLIAKFWNAPEIGIALSKQISKDPGYSSSSLDSEYGFTSGYEGHHEFGYFWKRWFKFNEIHFLDYDKQSRVDVEGLQRSLSIMESTWKRPLLFKNPAALPLQTEFLAKIMPTSLFIYIKRDITTVARSLFNARIAYLNDSRKWFSIKPKEYTYLKDRNIPEQISGQVHYTKKELERQLELVPDKRKIFISFSQLCQNPDGELNKIAKFIKKNYSEVEERRVSFPALTISLENIDYYFLRQIEMCLERLNETQV